MSIPGIAEQITLDSGEAELVNITPDKNDLKKVTLEIAQLSKLHKTQRHVRVFDHKALYVKEKIGKQARHILIDLVLLDEKPVRVRTMSIPMLIASIVFGLLAFCTYYIESKGWLVLPELYMYGAIAGLALASIASLVFTVKSFKDSWVFKTAHGRVPMLSLLCKVPSKSALKHFLKALMSNIELARENNTYPQSKLLPAIVGEHRRLFEKHFITQEQFDQAKKNILGTN